MTTDNERALLVAIRDNDFQDGEANAGRPGHMIWVDCIDGWSGKTKFGGTMASLTAKGLVVTDGECCALTQAGLDTVGIRA